MPADSYDPRKVNLFAKNHKARGWAEGTFISGERNTDKVSLNVGSKGEVTKVINADGSGVVELTFKHNSASLSYFKRLYATSEWFPVTANDMGDGSRMGGTQAVVASMGNYERGDDVSDKTITLLLADYDEFY